MKTKRVFAIRKWPIVAVLGLFLACGDGDTTPTGPTGPPPEVDTGPSRTVETFDYTLVLFQNSYQISGPIFTTTAGGPVDVTATFNPVAGFTFEIDLLYLGTEIPHSEGYGGTSASGPGPTLRGHWDVGYVGEFQTRIYPLGALFPLPVPPGGLAIPARFTVEYP